MGELKPGTPLRLDELARSLGMSISPIREAVRQLEALGLAKHVPHQGARVLDFDIDELRDLFAVRLTIESIAVRRAAERFTEADAETATSPPAPADETRGARTPRSRCARTQTSTSRSTRRPTPRGCSADPPRVGPLGALPPAALQPAGDLQERHRQMDERLLAACVARIPMRPRRSTSTSSSRACSSRPSRRQEASSVATELGGKPAALPASDCRPRQADEPR